MEVILLLALAIGQCPRGGCAPFPPPMADPRTSANVNAARMEVLAHGYAYDERQPANPLTVAEYDPNVKAIRINASHAYWRDRDKVAKSYHDSGWFSTPHREHILRHEYGHAELHKAIGDRIIPLETARCPLPAARVASAVSQYAATSAAEFHAEVYAGLKYGRTFPPDVLQAYAEMTKP